ncbi:MAG: RNA methyltransferase [Cyanobacteria bacterium P01_F01_bin.150]
MRPILIFNPCNACKYVVWLHIVQVADYQFELERIVYSEKLLTAPLARKLVRQFRRAGVPTVKLSPEEFRSISKSHRASGVGAIVRQQWGNLKAFKPQMGLCWVILDQVRSPGNFGTLVRTLEAVGGAGFILLSHSIDPYCPDTIRASMGAFFRQQFIRTRYQDLQQWIKKYQGFIIGASPDAETNFHSFSYPKGTLLFLGEERQGLSSQQRLMCDALVKIPMVGKADSLNLGVAGSLLIYEVFRNSNSGEMQSQA